MSIDARLIKLGKLFVPKTNPFSDYNNTDEICNNSFFSTGYFNYISIYDISNKKGYVASMDETYTKSKEHIKIPDKDECSYQYVKVFTNVDICDEDDFEDNRKCFNYSKQEVESFWNKDKLVMFLSMIHIGNSNLTTVIERIEKTYKKYANDYLIYFTLDYSDIILFFKSDKIINYISIVEKLDFGFDDNLIGDSYTIYGYNSSKYKQFYEENMNKTYNDIDEDIWKSYCKFEESFYASINIGLESKNNLKQLINTIKSTETEKDSISFYNMYGRQDLSIVNTKANSKWLLYTLLQIDKASTNTSMQNNESDSVDKYANGVILYETFIKAKINIDDIEEVKILADNNRDLFFIKVKNKINYEFKKFMKIAEIQKPFQRYIIPIQEIKNSTLSIIKNNFAEEFILSMLESFLALLSHMKELILDYDKYSTYEEELKSLNDSEKSYIYYLRKKELENLFNNYVNDYLTALNCLVNTVMHSDRQFIQATAFNAVFFDVPPKLVAYYSTLIYQYKEIMDDNKDYSYSFVFTPNLKVGITLKPLTTENPPIDRLIIISITEDSMYSFKSVFRRLAHETAHFVGTKFRCRDIRMKKIIRTFFYLAFVNAIKTPFILNNHFFELNRNLSSDIETTHLICFDDEYSYRFEELEQLLSMSLLSNTDNKEAKSIHYHIKNRLNEYYSKHLKDSLLHSKNELKPKPNKNDYTENTISDDVFDYIENTLNEHFDIETLQTYDDETINRLCNSIANFLSEKLFLEYDELFSDNSQNGYDKRTHKQLSSFINIYKETFSDLQAIILLNLTFKEYLECFVFDENLNPDIFENDMTDLCRIVVVTKLMFDVGLWTDFMSDNKKVELLRKIVLYYSSSKYFHPTKDFNSNKIDEIKDLLEKSDYIKKYSRLNPTDIPCVSEEFTKFHMEYMGFPLALLYEYLVECLLLSLNQYKDRSVQIKQIQMQYQTLIDFKDIEKIMLLINNSNENYKKYIFEELCEQCGGEK